MGFTVKEKAEIDRLLKLMREHRSDPPMIKPVEEMTEQECELHKLRAIQDLIDTGVGFSNRKLLQFMKPPAAPIAKKIKEEVPADSTKATTHTQVTGSQTSEKSIAGKKIAIKKREVKLIEKKKKEAGTKTSTTLSEESVSQPRDPNEEEVSEEQAKEIDAKLLDYLEKFVELGTPEEIIRIRAMADEGQALERRSPQRAAKIAEVIQALETIKNRVNDKKSSRSRKHLVMKDVDLPDDYMDEPRLQRYKDVAKNMMAYVLPTDKLFPSKTVSTKIEYDMYMRNTDWRFVDYSNADVEANNSIIKEYVKDKEQAPKAQELPESRNPVDADIRVYSTKTGRQFKFNVGGVQQHLNGFEAKRLQLFLGASIFKEIVPKNYRALAQAAGSSDMRAFVGPVRKVHQDDEVYATGPIYEPGRGIEPKIDFDIERAYCVKRFFRGGMPQEYNDCVVHAVNTALGFPYFRYREQVIRLMARRQYRTMELAAYKKHHFGVRMNIFLETFAVTKIADDKWRNYRFKKVMKIEFDKTYNKKHEEINLQRLDRLLQQGEIREGSLGRFILLAYFLDNCKHAYALCVDKKGVVALYDSSEKSVLYTNKLGDMQYKLSELYQKGHILNLYELRCTETKEPEHYTFIQQMMTGEGWSIKEYNEQRKQQKFVQELRNAAFDDNTSDSAESEGEPPSHRKAPRYNRRKSALCQKKQHRLRQIARPKLNLEPEEIEEEDYE